MSFDLSEFRVGDEFETSPYELSRIISAILAEGGSFLYEGNSIIITALPKGRPTMEHVKEAIAIQAKNIPEPKEEEEVVVEAPKPVVEADPEPDPEIAIALKPKGRPRKVIPNVTD